MRHRKSRPDGLYDEGTGFNAAALWPGKPSGTHLCRKSTHSEIEKQARRSHMRFHIFTTDSQNIDRREVLLNNPLLLLTQLVHWLQFLDLLVIGSYP